MCVSGCTVVNVCSQLVRVAEVLYFLPSNEGIIWLTGFLRRFERRVTGTGVSMLGKHWRDTKGGAPFQCSPESDLDFYVEPNEFHMMVCLGRPRLLREL